MENQHYGYASDVYCSISRRGQTDQGFVWEFFFFFFLILQNVVGFELSKLFQNALGVIYI
jgi:hypothetical protein